MALIRLNNQSLTNVTAAGLPTLAASNMPAGSVIQVVQGIYGSTVTSTTSIFATTNLSASITPNSTSSKILVVVHQNGVYKDGSNSGGVAVRLYRDGTEIADLGDRTGGDGSSVVSAGAVSISYFDSPATTSSVTYETKFRATSNASAAYVNVYNCDSTITLMEIAG